MQIKCADSLVKIQLSAKVCHFFCHSKSIYSYIRDNKTHFSLMCHIFIFSIFALQCRYACIVNLLLCQSVVTMECAPPHQITKSEMQLPIAIISLAIAIALITTTIPTTIPTTANLTLAYPFLLLVVANISVLS